ncbi:similar to Saccharomyces cerevisiae YGR271W SLH1 Putative RNA helicase related to Ski2p, involved in translation inhibition of non-poly(A) mRNAs [Maudiozyma saulgeensis]|uniref:Similar to Saccharomyces cerevisiae YGR271W SLH1 Putative RNA helicase related to Ski2p, involved in translation inhibition of non-poly(A) mRNAs n=1 Tax=Maudiozyma saulgeensis TaxID=1789683 RepID=A0A1X7R9Q6_9SACH|nr:similar to Saccharomyces cerevisiae YGR271W SLH1 Putative RNA helicase related to Ski2p, involved in translation inhibition of non-poly(A) mRNAs [Kazachstania saulgeensis]
MSTSYSVDSSKSYMIAMQSMVDTVEKLNLKLGAYIPEVDNEVKKVANEKNEGAQLAVLAQDRNKWDDIYDQFNDVSFENLQKVIKSYKSSNSNNKIYREFGKLIDLADSLLPKDVFTESLLQIVYNNGSNALEKELLDFLGASNIELISFLIQNQSTIKSIPLEETLFMIQDATNPNKRLTQEGIRNQVLENAARAKNPKLDAAQKIIKYPHVYRKYESNTSSALSIGGQKFALPVGTTRMTYQAHEEIIIPAPDPEKNKSFLYTKLLKIKDLDFLCRSVFKYETLNQIQTLVYPVAYTTNENMLICAPTGAGKTDIALLTILNAIKQYSTTTEGGELDIQYDDFKVIYVAPLKALAAEIVSKFSEKLSIFDIKVRELTGDMQMTKAEVLETQIIVTTPEKWDVVTRKANGDNDLVSKVKLLIIDEVHLLHEDRGSVIETLVARTLRQVESSQSMIRILGLSATLPNFMDVADFLGVNRQIGMFYFDQCFRPKPLEQQLLGCRGKAGTMQSKKNIDEVSYEKLLEMIKMGYQVMVFVHSRKDTVKSARTFIKMAQENHEIEHFEPDPSAKDIYSKQLAKNRDRDLKEIFQFGFGVHHAGMSRSDRNLTEKLFKEGATKVLCCTATLAWGVNLSADCVIIKGTQVYDSKKGGFIDLGISDVIQIFGRAGRPGFGSANGTGILCTSNDKLDHYVSLITQQHPIESRFGAKLVDNLNAEISLGTVTNVEEAIEWLGYTYIFVRMKKNPFTYGIDWDEIASDPQLYDRRKNMIITAARRLHALQMIVFDEISAHFIPKDLGRVSSDFYLLNDSIEIFNQMCDPRATEADVLSMISMSSEFDGIKFREDESSELKRLSETSVACQIGSPLDTSQGKTNVLLQAYISQSRINDSALSSDSNYVAQNSVRICRALFLIGINRRWGNFSKVMLDICKSIDKRIWAFDHPLCQFDLPENIMRQIREKNPSMEYLLDLEPQELGELVHNSKMGGRLYSILSRFPRINIESEIFPITSNVMRIHTTLTPDFKWDTYIHGNAQFFWVIVEESDKSQILHFEKFILNKRQLDNPHEMDFMIPLSDPLPPQVVVKVVSDTWIGCESVNAITFQHLIRPFNETLQTRLERLRPLPINALQNPLVESIYPFKYFNPMQTMTFHTLYNTNDNVFVGSPTGSGKTVVAELAMWHAFRDFPGSKIVYIAPMKALVRERVDDWRKRVTPVTGDKVVELTGDSLPDPRDVADATIVITTPEKFDGISRNWQTRKFVQDVSLVIMDEIHLLASDRGPILEMIVSRMNYISSQTHSPIRLLGMSTAVSNAYDMASWLGIKNNGLFNFPSSVRPVPLKMYIDGFPDNLAFCPLMKTMNKPAFMAIKQHSPNKPALIFVASRRQTRLTALDLIHLCGMEDNPRRFLNIDDEDELQYYISQVTDDTLKLSLQFGIGLHHAGLVEKDRSISHKLFQMNKIQILIATSTLAWGVNLPAHLVIIKGTQFFDAKIEGYRDMDLTDILQMMGRAGRPAYDTSGTAIVYTKDSKKMFYKHFLNVGFPVESSLHKVLDDHLGAEISSGTIKNKQDALDFLNWTFLFRRVHHNPTYYGIEEDTSEAGVTKHLSELVDSTMNNLAESKCVSLHGTDINATPFLGISSYYYISHLTIRQLLKQIHNNATFNEVLKWLSLAFEYNELPVRGGEIIMNVEMSARLRYSVESTFNGEYELPMWDPHVKAFLLLQAHMSRVDLPIADYIQDTVSVLDQSLRILQAFIDVASELGYFQTVLTMIKAMQCIKQGYWYEDDPIGLLPGIDIKRRTDMTFNETGYPTEDTKENDKLTTLEKLGHYGVKKLQPIMDRFNIPTEERGKFVHICQRIPVLDEIHFEKQTDAGQLTLYSKHVYGKSNKNFEIYCDKFPKTQKEVWFCIAYQGDELLMVKRCQPRQAGKTIVVGCDLIIPEEIQGEKLEFILINDAMDLKYRVSHQLI